MEYAEVEKLAKALFEKENQDPYMVWAEPFMSRTGQDIAVGVGEDIRELYRQRVRDAER
ncbi:hypothetical protein QO002_002170 [Pararhizobium capsulatum DSM 1112]|uniref:Uncharacterized protein n=1 Tax=Pararhizobium capsulatum DSM 1112 TaxID=1121113 RepID=A0ABU0BT44_9HYPH|nr:hypothetical protein [Pararhizobium capsulatum]MDQ0320032.1 hypothetical protein [Pararhizobium capsulatum DSM 1112]